MATIKEVAKLAGVSIGTVSNVLNGKTLNTELIDRVEDAMQQLSYRPDANARSLKNTKSKLIGVILPNIIHPDFTRFLTELEILLREKGYGILLKISQNNRLLEKKSIAQCLEQCVDGIIFYSSAKKDAELATEQADLPLVLVSKYQVLGFAGDTITMSYKKALWQSYEQFREKGIDKIGFIFESKLLLEDASKDLLEEKQVPEQYIKIVDYSKERGFKAAYELFYQYPEIKGIVASNSLIATGVNKALELLERKDVFVVTFKENNWIEDSDYNDGIISISQKEVVERTVSRLLEAIDNPNVHEPMTEVIHARFEHETRPLVPTPLESKELRFAMFDSPVARGLQMLARMYEEKTNIQLNFDLLGYGELEELIRKNGKEKNPEYDGYMLDITWLDEAVLRGGILCLEDWLNKEDVYLNGFIDEMLREYGMYEEKLYALPFMSGTQLLFFQKDLFEDQTLKRQFLRQYGEELVPPFNWAQFNLVSEFFTRAFNPKSPVQYGTASIRGENVFHSIGFLNRLWAYGADIFDEEGNVIIHSQNALTALKSYTKSFQYSSIDAKANSWDDMVLEFKKGKTAMLLMYDSHAMEINDYTKSKVAGNIGSVLIPGGTPVLGGWSLGLNAYGKEKEASMAFLKWVCSEENSIPLSLLGGSTVRKSYYERMDLENMYPWKKLILESYKQSRKRKFPSNAAKAKRKNEVYMHTIPYEINRVLAGEITEEEALFNMEHKIKKLFE
jgi:multiple sugar transport system substrate-binding protein